MTSKPSLPALPHSWSELSWQQLCVCWQTKMRYGGNSDVARVAALLDLLGCTVCREKAPVIHTLTGETVYQLRDREYTPEEVRMILADQGDMYAEDETTVLFRILSKEGGPLKDGQADIVRIGFYENAGTLVERSVFDLENRVFYVDGPEPHPMSEAQAEELKQLPGRWGIPAWDVHTEGKEAPNTGNYGWKLIFELSNGEYAVYDGFTGDMSHLPKHFAEVRDTLYSVQGS